MPPASPYGGTAAPGQAPGQAQGRHAPAHTQARGQTQAPQEAQAPLQGPGSGGSTGTAQAPPPGRQQPVQGSEGAWSPVDGPIPAPQPTQPAQPDRPTVGWGHSATPAPAPAPASAPAADLTETAALPVVGRETPAAAPAAPSAEDDRRTVGLRKPTEAELGGRAARRRAAQGRGRAEHRDRAARGRADKTPPPAPRPAGTRLEARRAARAAKDGPAIIASRFIGEAFITVGVLMLLFVAYQLWWTNVLAGQQAGGAASDLQEQWKDDKGDKQPDPERAAGEFAPGEGFAIIHIPKIGIDSPIAQGVSKKQVLDKGMVGHYDEEPLKTAMPWDKKGNFALAGHRNTHGEPFRYINKLVAGDEIVVETASKFYTYEMTNRLPSTSPSNTGVIGPVPPQSGFKEPGRYITLTTCTPEFTSKYRLIVWGKMVDERPRSKGKPDALVE
ncbi:class E sortase [Streptomyces sp. NPDC054796]